jgi:hypothetical protein
VTRALLAIAIAACTKSPPQSPGTPPDPCAPETLGLAGAKRLAAFPAPASSCSITAPELPEIITVATRVFDCKGAQHGFDFERHRLLAHERTLSPATVGVDAYDDGRTITFVGRQRAPCPGDPRPMPVPVTLLYTIETSGERTFAEAACTVTPACR